jgi:hypothetical protein
MTPTTIRRPLALLSTAALVGFVMMTASSPALPTEIQDLEKVPRKVMETLRNKFPGATIDKWTREKEGDVVIYDFEMKHGRRKFEADIREDGTLHNWEKEVGVDALPAAVKKAVETRYPNSTIKEIMAITAVKNGREELEGFEIVLRTVQKEEVEVSVAPSGKILEDSGEKK